MSQFAFVSHLICSDTSNASGGNENNLMVWSEGENNITQAINTGGLLADLSQWPANCASHSMALLRKRGMKSCPKIF